MANNPPRNIDIRGQDHMLAYITPEEGGILQLLGGSGAPGPMGIPSFFDAGPGDTSTAGVDDAPGDNTGTSNTSSGASTGDGNTDSYSDSDFGSFSDYSTVDNPAGSGNMGLEDMGIADQNTMMGGLSAGVTGLQTMQGAANYSPVKNVAFDIFNLKDKMNKHARDSLARGYAPEFSVDKDGNVTSVTGKGGASTMPGIGGLMSMIGANMGAVTTTGYAGKGVDDNDIGGNESSENNIVRDARTFLGEDIAEINSPAKVIGESFIDPAILKYLRGQRGTLPTLGVGSLGVGYAKDNSGYLGAKPVDFSAIDRGLQKTQAGIQAINRNRY